MGPAVPEKKCSSKMLSDRLIGICAGDVIASKKIVDIFVGALLAAGAQLVVDGSWEEVDVWRHQDLPQIPHTQLNSTHLSRTT